MVRAAAKNHANVAIVVSPDELRRDHRRRSRPAARRSRSAARSPARRSGTRRRTTCGRVVASAASSRPTSPPTSRRSPRGSAAPGRSDADLRYGENSHQKAALYGRAAAARASRRPTQLHGKEMSYNNYVDADAAVRAAFDFDEPAVAIIKHANPCGIAIARPGIRPIADAHARAHACDPVSAFGGVIAANRADHPRDGRVDRGDLHRGARRARLRGRARSSCSRRRRTSACSRCPRASARTAVELRQVSGGLLLQQADRALRAGPSGRSRRASRPTPTTLADLEFAWRACRAVKSNAILLATGGASVGVGMGQVNRVDSCQLAVERAGDRAAGRSRHPTPSSRSPTALQILIDGGVRAVVQPGGSVRDEEVIAAAQRGRHHDVLHRRAALLPLVPS